MKTALTLILTAFVTFWTGFALAYPMTPNPETTPGALCSEKDRHFAGYRHPEHLPVCRRKVEHELKDQIYDRYGIPERCRQSFIIDHLIPLSIGGNNSRENLWPEHHTIRDRQIRFEQEVFDEVSAGKLTQAQAVEKVRAVKFNPDSSFQLFLTEADCNSPERGR
jgi:hypothetical protein